MKRHGLLLLCAWALAACGAEPVQNVAPVGDVTLGDGAATDAGPRPDSGGSNAVDSGVVDSGGSSAGDTGSGGDSAASGLPAGAPCVGDGDCASAVCVLSRAGGKRCASPCTDTCGDGQRCVYSPVHKANICADAHLTLCDPCDADVACRHLGGDASACVSWGAEGSFCGSWCGADADCPAGFACAEGTSVDGLAVKQCRPAAGAACTCSPSAIASGAKTSCGDGACKGTRTCGAGGLGACVLGAKGSESCNGIDDDCDGQTDEPGAAGCKKGYVDKDGDGYGVGQPGACVCGGAGASKGGDCKDGDKTVHPGAKEACNGKDDDCDGQTDEPGATGCKSWYVDADKDGWGAKSQCRCKAGGGYTASKGGDCKDNDKAVNPGKAEVCNGKDDNCKGGTDEGGVCAPKKPKVCYPGTTNAYNVCFDLTPLAQIKSAAYVWPSSSAANYKSPVNVLNLGAAPGSTKVAKNFVLSELMQASKGQYGVFSAQTVARLQSVRTKLGVPLTVNSGFRSPGYNKGVPGAATLSRHQYGDAADVTTKGKTSLQAIVDACKAYSADYTQLYTSHVHCDWRNDPLGHDFWPKKASPPPPLPGAHRHAAGDHEVPSDEAAWRQAFQQALWARPLAWQRSGDLVELEMTWGAAFDEGTPWVTWRRYRRGRVQVIDASTRALVRRGDRVCWEVGATLRGCADVATLLRR